MSRLFEAYRALYEQAFVPIFTRDGYDSHMLLEACLEAGVRVIEYTLRRPDARQIIPWIRQHHPELILLVGSTIDDPEMVRRARRRHPQLLTLEELEAIGVDGFVSLLGFTQKSIRRYAATHLVIPAAMTLREAFEQSAAGAQFIKLLGPDLALAQLCANPGAYGFTPLFITGGMTTDRLPEAFAAGVHVAGTGFEFMLRDQPANPGRTEVAGAVRRHVETARQAQRQRWPDLARAEGAAPQAWLDALPHNTPFQTL
jgi:2-keto-3-deoxy-6-phosphogluconate aldolase